MLQATNAVWARGGVAGFFQGLIPWVCKRLFSSLPFLTSIILQAWIEASTKGAVLLFTASEIESSVVGMGISPAAAGLLGGMGGGIAQAYATMGKWTHFVELPMSCNDTHCKASAARRYALNPAIRWDGRNVLSDLPFTYVLT